MADDAPQSLRERNRQSARDMVLDAAERLLQTGETADFSMRALAAEAGVGFATPFNHFGSKTAIMQALSSRMIERMASRFRNEAPPGDAVDRVLAMERISAGLLLEQPEISRIVVGSLGLAGAAPSAVRPQSEAIWSLALGEFSGSAPKLAHRAQAVLPQQLAFMFRGCVSFWIAGELGDAAFLQALEAGASTLLLAFAIPDRRAYLHERITALVTA